MVLQLIPECILHLLQFLPLLSRSYLQVSILCRLQQLLVPLLQISLVTELYQTADPVRTTLQKSLVPFSPPASCLVPGEVLFLTSHLEDLPPVHHPLRPPVWGSLLQLYSGTPPLLPKGLWLSPWIPDQVEREKSSKLLLTYAHTHKGTSTHFVWATAVKRREVGSF